MTMSNTDDPFARMAQALAEKAVPPAPQSHKRVIPGAKAKAKPALTNVTPFLPPLPQAAQPTQSSVPPPPRSKPSDLPELPSVIINDDGIEDISLHEVKPMVHVDLAPTVAFRYPEEAAPAIRSRHVLAILAFSALVFSIGLFALYLRSR